MSDRPQSILELRVALTVPNYESTVAFYRDGLGVDPAQLWVNENDRAILFELGRATLEVFDEPHAVVVDDLEVGKRVSGTVRFALQVPDVTAALERALAHGATLVHAPVLTPWRDYNARIQAPDGMQITLFQVMGDSGA